MARLHYTIITLFVLTGCEIEPTDRLTITGGYYKNCEGISHGQVWITQSSLTVTITNCMDDSIKTGVYETIPLKYILKSS